jgi:hypothetical protein
MTGYERLRWLAWFPGLFLLYPFTGLRDEPPVAVFIHSVYSAVQTIVIFYLCGVYG